MSCRLRRAAELAGQPGPREAPLARQRAWRHVKDGGSLVDAQPGEVTEHGNLGQVRLLDLELPDRLVHSEEVVGRRLNNGNAFGQLDALAATTVLLGPLAPCLFDQNVPHRACRSAEEMAATMPAGILIARQAQVRLVDEGGRL